MRGRRKGGVWLDDFPTLTLPTGPPTELGTLPPAPSQVGVLRGPREGPLRMWQFCLELKLASKLAAPGAQLQPPGL